MPERLPLCVASAGRAVSLYSLAAWVKSDFLFFDLTTPACMSHLHVSLRWTWPVDEAVLAHAHCPATSPPPLYVEEESRQPVPTLRLPLARESTRQGWVG